MKRWILALAAVVVGATGLAQADYIRIVVNLGISKEKLPEEFQMGIPGMLPGGMMPGMGPGGIGPGGMGPGGIGPGGMGPGGMEPGGMGPGAMGPGGGRFAGGGRGFRGGAGGVGGQGFRGGAGGFAGGAGGFAGGGDIDSADGGMGPGGMMPGGMMPGGMMPGMMGGMMGGMGGFGFFGEEEPEFTPLYVVAVIEVDERGYSFSKKTRIGTIRHKWGSTKLTDVLGDVEVKHVPMPTVRQRYQREFSKLDKEPRPDKLLELAGWVLTHGLLDKFPEIMDKLAKADPKHPALLAYRKVHTAMERPVTRDDPAVSWQSRLGDHCRVKESKHYVLIYDVPSPEKAQRWLDQMEATYKGFFYWFALRGMALEVPDRRLVAVLLDNPEVFEHQHKQVFDSLPMVADGFYARRDNLAVFSATRLDDAFEALDKTVTGYWRSAGMDEAAFLQGKITRKFTDPENLTASTLTLVHRLVRDESEVATVSYECTRQLIAAVGLLPRAVQAPQWNDFGMASFFETPRGAFWPGFGAPSWAYLVHYKQWESAKKLDDPVKALTSVVTDRYFREAAASKQKEKPQLRARAMAWALNYYLMHKKLGGLMRYYQELSQMPRDMELDETVLLQAFARAFDLLDPAKPGTIDQTKLYNMAKEWRQFIQYTPTQVALELLTPPKMPQRPGAPGENAGGRENAPGTNPSAPGRPRGRPGAGPGGSGS